MNFELNLFSVFFVILMIYLTVAAPVSGYFELKKLKKFESSSENKKLKEYRHIIIWSWIPVILIFLQIPLSDMTPGNLGFRWITINPNAFSNWIVIPFIVVCLIYFLYNVYLIINLKTDEKVRAEASKKLPDDVMLLLPVTKREKKTWVYVALTAGITEEIVYRGYLFFALEFLFPSLSIFYTLLISTVLFGIGHLYQGKEAVKPVILGLLFGFSYIIFDSIIPVMLLHITQDLVVTDLIDGQNI